MSFFLKPRVCVYQRIGLLGPLGTTLDASQVPRVNVRRAGDRAQNVWIALTRGSSVSCWRSDIRRRHPERYEYRRRVPISALRPAA
jgi:hypothetical protein